MISNPVKRSAVQLPLFMMHTEVWFRGRERAVTFFMALTVHLPDSTEL